MSAAGQCFRNFVVIANNGTSGRLVVAASESLVALFKQTRPQTILNNLRSCSVLHCCYKYVYRHLLTR